MDKLLFKRILVAVLSVLAVVYVVYLLISANFNVYPTENAVETSVTDTIYTNAFIIRDENYIRNNSSGVLSYTVDDGDEVSAGGTIAKIYSSEGDAAAQTKADSLEEQLASLKELEQSFQSNTIGIDTINNEINNDLITYLYNINSSEITQTDKNISDLLYSINQRQAYTGSITSFSSEISELEGQIEQLRASSGSSVGEISTPKAGYFSAYCDGYENCFKYSDIDNITLDDIKGFKKSSVDTDVAGKVISSLNWYIACEVTADEATDLTLWDSNVTVNFSDASSDSVLASIYKIEQYPGEDTALLILKCSYMNSDLSATRIEPIEIGLGTYTGFRVSKKALHDDYVQNVTYDENGNQTTEEKKVQGVYVLYGSEIQFKEVSVLYAGNDYVICDPNPADGVLFSDDTISLYDQVILEGDNMYDGKVIK